MFFISGAKERAPAAAMHLLSLLEPNGPKPVSLRSRNASGRKPQGGKQA
jgi:hypothetical protein